MNRKVSIINKIPTTAYIIALTLLTLANSYFLLQIFSKDKSIFKKKEIINQINEQKIFLDELTRENQAIEIEIEAIQNPETNLDFFEETLREKMNYSYAHEKVSITS